MREVQPSQPNPVARPACVAHLNPEPFTAGTLAAVWLRLEVLQSAIRSKPGSRDAAALQHAHYVGSAFPCHLEPLNPYEPKPLCCHTSACSASRHELCHPIAAPHPKVTLALARRASVTMAEMTPWQRWLSRGLVAAVQEHWARGGGRRLAGWRTARSSTPRRTARAPPPDAASGPATGPTKKVTCCPASVHELLLFWYHQLCSLEHLLVQQSNTFDSLYSSRIFNNALKPKSRLPYLAASEGPEL